MDDKNNINDELNDNLQEIAPTLSKLKKEEHFGLPADYFEDLSSKIQEKCADADEIREIAPVLSELSKYNPFTVPNGYFDELPARVQEKCIRTHKPSWAERLALLFRPGFAIPIAVAVIALVIAFVMINGNGSKPAHKQEIASLDLPYDSNSTDAITEEALLTMNDADLLETLWDEPLAEPDDHHYISGHEEEIIDYLLDNNADISGIVNEL